MIGHGVSSRSSHSLAAGRITSLANPCTQSRRSVWSSLSSREKAAMPILSKSGPWNVEQAHESGREGQVTDDLELACHEQHRCRGVAGGQLQELERAERDGRLRL